MPRFSKKSLERLVTCHEDLQLICNKAIKIMDFSVLCGHRGEEEQNRAFEEGNSKARWGQSKHNSNPSRAVDIVPYPVDWEDTERFARLAGIIEVIAHSHNIRINWGGDWKMRDMPHFELVED